MIDAKWFAQKITDRSLTGISLATRALIRSGDLPVGTHLPPLRDIAFELGVSPATVSSAWRDLRQQKLLSGRGRNGTFVTADQFIPRPERLASSGNYGPGVLDLSQAIPDPDLLPDLRPALAHATELADLNSYDRSRIVAELETEVRSVWPYDPEALLATSGGYQAIFSITNAMIPPGSLVAMEMPTAMRLLDIFEAQGCQVLPVETDIDGPRPEALARALMKKPVAFVFQPRLHSVTSHLVTPERLAALGDILEISDCLIIEDDGVGQIGPLPPQSLGGRFPDRVFHVMSFSKSFGPDLRLGVLSASREAVGQVQSYRSFSAGWTSRLLQRTAAWLLQDQKTADALANARKIYCQRKQALVTALRARGIALPPPSNDGLSIWLPVESERFALVTLAARRIAVAAGSKYTLFDNQDHIRLGTGCLTDNVEAVADAIALSVEI